MAETLNFDSMPTELKIEVFKNTTSTQDQKKVRLVCRQWNDLMSPIMWHSFNVSFSPRSRRDIHALLSSTNGVTLHVRHLRIIHHMRGDDLYSRPYISTLVASMKLHSLVSFRMRQPIPSADMLTLLRNQALLRELDLSLDMSDLPTTTSEDQWLVMHSVWLPSRLADLQSLTCVFGSESEAESSAACARFNFFVANSPRLAHLEFRVSACRSYPPGDNFSRLIGPPAATLAQPLRLRSLYFEQLDLQISCLAALQRIDFRAVQELRIVQCNHPVQFMKYLSQTFQSIGSSLRTLEIDRSSQCSFKGASDAIGSLLLSFTGLQTLIFDMSITDKRGIIVDPIVHHRETLSHLVILSNRHIRTTSPPHFQLQSICSMCPHLTQLSIHLPGLTSWEFGTMYGRSWTLNTAMHQSTTELLNTLQAIATATGLHTLNNLTPSESTNRNVPHSRYTERKYAFQVMKYLRTRGSQINLLVSSRNEWYPPIVSKQKGNLTYLNEVYWDQSSGRARG